MDIFLHRVLLRRAFTCGVHARLLSVITPNTLWFCTSSMMLPVRSEGGDKTLYFAFLSSDHLSGRRAM